MKYIFITIIGLMLALSTTEIQAQDNSKDAFTVKVDGLGCPFCAYGLEKKFKELKGINDVNIDMETGIFTFTFPTDKALSVQKVENQVDAAGYTAVKVDVMRADGTTETTAVKATEVSDMANVTEDSFFVGGNCDMCKARIEKTASGIAGVTKADWDKKSKSLKISYDKTQTNINTVAEAVAKAGHDTKTAKADNDTYDALPGCCHYDRMK